LNTRKDRKTAGELQQKVLADTTKYDALEVGHAMVEYIEVELYKSINIYKSMIDEDEFCVVMVIATDPLLETVKRRKFYCWPFLPSPRPNQSVFLYNKRLDRITKRLWVMPAPMVMAELITLPVVDKRYQTMQAWSVAFFKGTFWEYIRYEHKIDMPSETEYLAANREKLIQAGCKVPDSSFSEPFDFSKIQVNNITDTAETGILEQRKSLLV
jgi:hypothetical protein